MHFVSVFAVILSTADLAFCDELASGCMLFQTLSETMKNILNESLLLALVWKRIMQHTDMDCESELSEFEKLSILSESMPKGQTEIDFEDVNSFLNNIKQSNNTPYECLHLLVPKKRYETINVDKQSFPIDNLSELLYICEEEFSVPIITHLSSTFKAYSKDILIYCLEIMNVTTKVPLTHLSSLLKTTRKFEDGFKDYAEFEVIKAYTHQQLFLHLPKIKTCPECFEMSAGGTHSCTAQSKFVGNFTYDEAVNDLNSFERQVLVPNSVSVNVHYRNFGTKPYNEFSRKLK